MADRLEELDSVRGIAAATVVLCHATIVLPLIALPTWGHAGSSWVNWLKYSPAHALFAGHEAVITFFILSGFVLSLPYHRGSPSGYRAFVVKRVFRIYVPYLGAVLVGLLGMTWLARAGAFPGLWGWSSESWHTPVTVGLIAGHVGLVGSFQNGVVDPVLWSLVYEMRISLVFPLVMLALLRFGWRACLGATAALAVAGFAGTQAIARSSFPNDYLITFQYIPMFVIGAALAGRRAEIGMWYRRLPRLARASWLPAALLAYTFQWWALHGDFRPWIVFLNDWATTVGAVMMIVQAFASPAMSRVLRTRPLVFLGRISYSLYLLHAIVLLALLNLLYQRLPLALILVAAPAISVGVAALSFRWIEAPAMARGKRLAARLDRRERGGRNRTEPALRAA